jgi:Lrp/AsnC family transcriptional regulator, leucine-responsive regulatory protein
MPETTTLFQKKCLYYFEGHNLLILALYRSLCDKIIQKVVKKPGREKMLKEKEILILGHFRNDARISLTKLSKITKVPVSTIFDKIKEYKRTHLIKKYTSLIDFKKLGFEIRTQVLLSAGKDSKDNVQKFLMTHPRVNNIFRINNGYDFLIECIFKDMQELDEFTRTIDELGLTSKKEFFVMEDLKREEFMGVSQYK